MPEKKFQKNASRIPNKFRREQKPFTCKTIFAKQEIERNNTDGFVSGKLFKGCKKGEHM